MGPWPEKCWVVDASWAPATLLAPSYWCCACPCCVLGRACAAGGAVAAGAPASLTRPEAAAAEARAAAAAGPDRATPAPATTTPAPAPAPAPALAAAADPEPPDTDRRLRAEGGVVLAKRRKGFIAGMILSSSLSESTSSIASSSSSFPAPPAFKPASPRPRWLPGADRPPPPAPILEPRLPPPRPPAIRERPRPPPLPGVPPPALLAAGALGAAAAREGVGWLPPQPCSSALAASASVPSPGLVEPGRVCVKCRCRCLRSPPASAGAPTSCQRAARHARDALAPDPGDAGAGAGGVYRPRRASVGLARPLCSCVQVRHLRRK